MNSDEIATISGKRGYGKTTLAKTLILGLKRVAIWDIMGEYGGANAYIPHSGDVDEFDNWLKGHWDKGNVCLMIDEADMVMKERRELSPYANKIINLGRHRNIGLILITRRLANLNKTAVSQSTDLFLFHHFIVNDIKYLETMIGSDAQKLQLLQKYQYLHYKF